MRTWFSFIFFLVVMNVSAQKVGHVSISNSLEERWAVTEFDFEDYDCEEIDNDYLYTHVLWYVDEEGVETDSLIFVLCDFDKMVIKEISFTRNGTAYLSEDSFPAGDSVKWKLIKDGDSCRDSLVLRDSCLYYRLEPNVWGNDFIWFLGEKHRFCRYDTLKLFLDEKPKDLRVNIKEMFHVRGSDACPSRKRVKQIVSIDKKTVFMQSPEPGRLLVFDLRGRRRSALPGGPGVVLRMVTSDVK
jgi:hypothetical protein